MGEYCIPVVRPETPDDIDSIRYVNEQAFGQEDESMLIEKLRKRGVLAVSLVAVQDGEIVGHIAFSPVVVESEDSSFEVIALGPMAVLPMYQHKGIGSQMVLAGLEECRRLRQEIIVVLGHPDYYPRFGFVLAKPKGIACEFEVPEEAWMILELREEALAGRRGMVRFQPEFKQDNG
jgi:putative acetyltransferase